MTHTLCNPSTGAFARRKAPRAEPVLVALTKHWVGPTKPEDGSRGLEVLWGAGR